MFDLLAHVGCYRENSGDSRVARACRCRSVLQGTRQDKKPYGRKWGIQPTLIFKDSSSQMMMEICYLETVELHIFPPKILTHVLTEK